MNTLKTEFKIKVVSVCMILAIITLLLGTLSSCNKYLVMSYLKGNLYHIHNNKTKKSEIILTNDTLIESPTPGDGYPLAYDTHRNAMFWWRQINGPTTITEVQYRIPGYTSPSITINRRPLQGFRIPIPFGIGENDDSDKEKKEKKERDPGLFLLGPFGSKNQNGANGANSD